MKRYLIFLFFVSGSLAFARHVCNFVEVWDQ